ncbi:hypothetical protein HDV00_007713 [Rhizophlyctis rosea]|nr:hypothetical protein HDV00_007713 [Rhizophlyctis rosea]
MLISLSKAEELDKAHGTIDQQGSLIKKLNENCRMIIQAADGQSEKLQTNRARIDKLKQTCKLYSMTLHKLDKLIKDAEKEKHDLILSIDTLKRDRDDAVRDRQKLDAEMKQWELKATELQSAMSGQLHLALKEKEASIQQQQQVTAQVDTLTTQLAQARQQYLDDLASRKIDVSNELERAKNTSELLRKELHSVHVEKQVQADKAQQLAVEEQTKVQKLEGDIKRLHNIQEEAEDAKRRLQRDLERVQNELSAVQSDLSHTKSRCEQLGAELRESREEAEHLRAESIRIREDLGSELEQSRNRLAVVERASKAKEHELEDERNRLLREVASLQQFQAQLSEKNENVDVTLKTLSEAQRQEIESLTARSVSLQNLLTQEQLSRADDANKHHEQLKDVQQRADERYLKAHEDFNHKVGILSANIEELQATLATTERSHQRLIKEHAEDIERWQQKCQKHIDEQEKHETETRERVQLLQRRLDQAQLDLSTTTNKADKYEARLVACFPLKCYADERIQAMFKELSDLQPEHAALVRRNCELEAALITAEASKKSVLSRVQELECSLREQEDVNGQLQARISSSESNSKDYAERVTEQVAGLQESLSRATKERDDLHERIQCLVQEQETARNESLATLEEMKQLCVRKSAEIDTLNDALDAARCDKAELQVTLQELKKLTAEQEDTIQQVAALQTAHERVVAENESLRAQVNDYAVDRDISSQQIRQLKENLDTNVHLAEDNMRHRTRCDALTKEVETLRRQLQTASEKGSQMSPEKPQAATATPGATRQFPNTPQTSSTPRNNVRADAPEVPDSQSGDLPNATPSGLQKSSTSTQQLSVGRRNHRKEVDHPTPANQQVIQRGAVSRETPQRLASNKRGEAVAKRPNRTDAGEPLSDPPAYSQIESMQEGGSCSDDSDGSDGIQELLEVTHTPLMGKSSAKRPNMQNGRTGAISHLHQRFREVEREATPPLSASRSQRRQQQPAHVGQNIQTRRRTQAPDRSRQEVWEVPNDQANEERRYPKRAQRSNAEIQAPRSASKRQRSPSPVFRQSRQSTSAKRFQAVDDEADLTSEGSEVELTVAARNKRTRSTAPHSDDEEYEPTPVHRQNARAEKKARTSATTANTTTTRKRAQKDPEPPRGARATATNPRATNGPKSKRGADVDNEERQTQRSLTRRNTGYVGYAPPSKNRRTLSTAEVDVNQNGDDAAMFDEPWGTQR